MPEDTPVVTISSSHVNPDEIARRTFPAARKGVDGDAVRRYLESLADDLRAMVERETQLRRRVAEAERKASEPPVLDEATLTQAVGAETARVLQSAHDAARGVVARAQERASEMLELATTQAAERTAAAEEESARLLEAATESAGVTAADADAQAAAVKAAAEEEAEAVLDAAHDDAVALLDTTKQRCRQTVRDARRLRAEVLSDLVERRRALFVQLEQLRSGRDSLVEVVETVESTVEALQARLAGAEHDARIAAAEGGDRAELFVDDEVEVLMGADEALEEHAELLGDDLEEKSGEDEADALVAASADPVVDLAGEDLAEDEDEQAVQEVQAKDSEASHRSVGELFARIRAARGSEPEAAADTLVADAVSDEGAVAASGEPAAGDEAEVAAAGTSAGEAGDAGEAASSDEVAATSDEPAPDASGDVTTSGESGVAADAVADEVVLQTDATVTGADDESSVGEQSGTVALDAESDETAAIDADADARRRRDEVVAPVMSKLSRALKRALQDDQNDLLNALRRASGTPDLDKLLPEGVQRERFAGAASSSLAEGWLNGRVWLRPDGEKGDGGADEAAETGKRLGLELAAELAGLLRHRLSESLHTLGETGEGAQDAAGAAYREWKGPRVEGLAGDFATRAFAQGAVDAAADGTIVRWVVDDGKPCPDCDDNALAGGQPAGELWPTGQAHPPVHPGCRCLLVATTD
ncbi:MAG: DivIVA domain-containing protein [Acidimicrobiales bacterium]|jgi:hypothetical protein